MLDFSNLAPVYVPVRGPDGNDYVLMQASADAKVKHENRKAAAGVWKDGRIAGFQGMADCEPELVANCLAVAERSGEHLTGKPKLKRDSTPLLVSENLVRSWPAEVMDALYEKVLDISPGMRPAMPSAVEQFLKLDLSREQVLEAQAGLAKKLEALPDPKELPADGAGTSEQPTE